MEATAPKSARAARAAELVRSLQSQLVTALEHTSRELGSPTPFEPVSWLRDGGRHGGGVRYVVADTPVYDRASVNVSVVHYDDTPEKRLGSATALSTIVHPANPHAPSMHMHISWTEMRDGSGYWRMMADLNPSLAEQADAAVFAQALIAASGQHYAAASAQGDRYFRIPALDRHRGVAHFYLEAFSTDDPEADLAMARSLGEAVIETYTQLVRERHAANPEPGDAAHEAQLTYHTLYLFQVLTLDRGTTSGLLVHDQNDVGILGSLPSHVDRELLASWAVRVPEPQDELVAGLVAVLSETSPSLVDEPTKRALAQVVRRHYQLHPEALALQASGDVIPPTVANHR